MAMGPDLMTFTRDSLHQLRKLFGHPSLNKESGFHPELLEKIQEPAGVRKGAPGDWEMGVQSRLRPVFHVDRQDVRDSQPVAYSFLHIQNSLAKRGEGVDPRDSALWRSILTKEQACSVVPMGVQNRLGQSLRPSGRITVS